MMKNMKVAQKLILGFCIVAVLCAVVGAVGILGMYRINLADTALYEEQTKPLPDIAKVLEYSQRLRIELRNAIIYAGDAEMLKTVEANMIDREEKLEAYMAAYDATIKDAEARKAFDEAMRLYNSVYIPAMNDVLEGAKSGADLSLLLVKMEEAGAATNSMVDNFTACMNMKVAGGEASNKSNDALYANMLAVIIAAIAVALAVALLLAFYISGMISKPISLMSQFLTRFGTAGDLEMTAEDRQAYERRGRDEIGRCQDNLGMVLNRLQEVNLYLDKVADGDLTLDMKVLSERDTIGIAINKMVESLNAMFGEIQTASGQVSAGAVQVSQAAQGLASGSSEQAASIQEFTAALTELQEKTNHNAESTEKAREVNNQAGERLEGSIRSMGEMLEAMKAIDESSQSITSVINVIDNIAFQTNILALNAAVEAARAGQHGKGFAVVADEVRNLASKSAAAAKETAALIEGSSERVKEGNQIVTKTNADLEAAAENARESTRLIEQVAVASMDQARSIGEINQGIEQISTVVQANSATAEESAAAAEEMSAQSEVLNEIVAKFRLKQSGPERSGFSPSGKSDGFGDRRPGGQFESAGFALSQGKY